MPKYKVLSWVVVTVRLTNAEIMANSGLEAQQQVGVMLGQVDLSPMMAEFQKQFSEATVVTDQTTTRVEELPPL